MKYHSKRMIGFVLIISFVFTLAWVVNAQEDSAETVDGEVDEALIERGEYLARISRCVGCHTPQQDEFSNPAELSEDQRLTLSLFGMNALDLQEGFLSGGRTFNLGPAGTIIASNITSDEETGIGAWTDEELEVTMRTGINPAGRELHPLMPTRSYANWAAEDMAALIAYLRTVPPVENAIEVAVEDAFEQPALENLEFPEASPEDSFEYGEYLVNDVMRCTGCHTPTDPNTGRPDSAMFLGGGQAYEGPWGIVYGGNITNHPETGLGNWTNEDIIRVFREGVNINGRRLILMPWQDYSPITDSDLEAVIKYIRGVEQIENEVPSPSVNETFEVFAED